MTLVLKRNDLIDKYIHLSNEEINLYHFKITIDEMKKYKTINFIDSNGSSKLLKFT